MSICTLLACSLQVAPSHEGIELGIGDATLIKVFKEFDLALLSMHTAMSVAKMHAAFRQERGNGTGMLSPIYDNKPVSP